MTEETNDQTKGQEDANAAASGPAAEAPQTGTTGTASDSKQPQPDAADPLVVNATQQDQVLSTTEISSLTTEQVGALTTAGVADEPFILELKPVGPAPAAPYHLIDTQHGFINEIAQHLDRAPAEAIAAIEALTLHPDHVVNEVRDYKTKVLNWLRSQF
jgi:hypothetical protein